MKVDNLKYIFMTGLTLMVFSTTVMAQKGKKYKVIEKTLTSEIINVSADSLWTILREFDKVANWTSVLDHSEGAGEVKFEGATCNERVCTQGRKKLVEELTAFSDEKKELTYELIEGAPSFVKLAKNHWKVIKIGPNKSKVQMNITMHLSKLIGFFLGGVITKTMTKQVLIVQNDLKIYAETGEVSDTKKEQLIKKSN